MHASWADFIGENAATGTRGLLQQTLFQEPVSGTGPKLYQELWGFLFHVPLVLVTS